MSMLSSATNPQFAGFVDYGHHFALGMGSFSLTSPHKAAAAARKRILTERMNTISPI
jgi:hypothetical protein